MIFSILLITQKRKIQFNADISISMLTSLILINFPLKNKREGLSSKPYLEIVTRGI
jgi:hypothetical protein